MCEPARQFLPPACVNRAESHTYLGGANDQWFACADERHVARLSAAREDFTMIPMLQHFRLPDRRDAQGRARGFTLIEVMIVVAIIAIIAAVALPAYFDSVRKSRRGEAISALNQIAQQQERWRANNTTYSNSLAAGALNVANPSSGYYTLSVGGNTATAYVATATAAGAQASDAKCTTLTLSMSGGTITYGSTGTATPNKCWNR